jgi:C4-dicarboxylate-specific signal transduction histidine kinase
MVRTGGDRLLRIKTERLGHDQLRMTIEDTGSWVAPDGIERVFNAFKNSGAHGVGLRLAISRMIIERHGGRLTAAARTDTAGTCFQLALPLVSVRRDSG